VDDGVTLKGRPVGVSDRHRLAGATVVASRTEVGRGQWDHLEGAPLTVRPLGSVAYKLALVAAGLADATWTLVPKHEWDVAAGVALVLGAGGEVWIPNGGLPRFNQPDPRLPGLVAAPRPLGGPLRQLLGSGAT
jgi:myo-inositol-1(or 4)-monophosphatase